MKTIKAYRLNLLIIVIFFTGCFENHTPKPNLKTLKDITLKTEKNGDVNIEKKYDLGDGNSTIISEKISGATNKIGSSKDYEKVPNFEKNFTSNLSIKNKKNKERKILVKGEKVKISVESIPVNKFIDVMFSNVLKLNYAVSEEVKKMMQPVTLNMSTLEKRQNVFNVTKKLLALNGVALKKEDNIFYLYKSNQKNKLLADSNIYVGYGRSISSSIPDDENILMFVSLEHIDTRNAKEILNKSGIDIKVYSFSKRGLQLIKAKAGEVRKALKLLNLIDRPYLEGKQVYLLDLNFIETDHFVKRVKTIFSASGINVSSKPSASAILISAIPELNSILAISPNPSWMEMLFYWKEKLDVESEKSPIPKFYTYKVKYRKADELANALNSVIELKLSNTTQNTLKRVKTEGKEKKQERIASKIDHTIKADLPTNTLMMQLLPSEYRKILPLIEELDSLPKQVLVEVTLAEVTLTDTFNLGFEYALRNDVASGANALTSAAIGAAFGGSGFAATYNSKNLDATINAYAEDKLLSIISKPKLLILNNETGSINVGTQIPIVTSENSATDLGTGASDPSILRNISYRDTGVIVGLTPTINSNGILTMNIDLQLSEAQLNDTSNIDSPLIINRTIKTSLTLKHAETILLGGLISKNKSVTDSGVPYLMDIPWLGKLFQTKSEKIVKTELIMLIKPYIIQNSKELTQKTKKYKRTLKMLEQYSFF